MRQKSYCQSETNILFLQYETIQNMESYQLFYKSPIGLISTLCNENAIYYIGISRMNFDDDYSIENEPEICKETKHWFDIYFSGNKPDFTPNIEFFGTDFQKKVWTELLSIPFGKTVTYGEIAKRVGCRCPQAVGQVIGQNPILIIVPCHRVVGANGKLGGYSVGEERKIWLLKNEKAF